MATIHEYENFTPLSYIGGDALTPYFRELLSKLCHYRISRGVEEKSKLYLTVLDFIVINVPDLTEMTVDP